MRLLALWIGKLVYKALRLTGKRGSALPGLLVEKISPNFLKSTMEKIPEGVIIVTGTNGKTTSTKMLSHVLRANHKVLTNPTGSNFIRGIVSTIIHHSNWRGQLPYDIAVIELDEAYAAKFVSFVHPRATLVLNIMRDQMDRFGEIDHTAKLIKKVVDNTTDLIILNRDDRRVASLSSGIEASKVTYFGVAPKLRKLFINDDELHTGESIDTSTNKAIAELLDFVDEKIVITTVDTQIKLSLQASGTYNAHNAVAVFATALSMGMKPTEIANRISEVGPAFGRGEKITLKNRTVILQLVKNPGGFRHALISCQQYGQSVTMVAINDQYADGRDVSWLWDVNFAGSGGVRGNIITSGVRAADMALRLKYDDISTDIVEQDLELGLKNCLENSKSGDTIVIYTTYTAMLRLRKLISKHAKVDVI